MKNLPIKTFLLWSGLTYIPFAQARPTLLTPPASTLTDSIGIEKKDGKRFVLHRVDEGQTLYAIARRYGCSVADIQAANPDLKEAIRYNQVVRVPARSLSRKEEKALDKVIRKQEKAAKNEASDDPAKAGIHVVETGQTLYSLANRYGVAQADLRKWNSLSGNNVLIGQALIVSEKAYQARVPSTPEPEVTSKTEVTPKTTDTPARTVIIHPVEPRPTETRPASPTDPKPERRPDPEPINHPRPEPETVTRTTAPVPVKPADAAVEVELPRPGNDAPMPTRGRRISDSGIAEMIDGTDGSGKYLALHRTAPIGTLVQVRNEFNNQSLWVKVIGRLPDTGVNDKIMVKLSTQAFSKLSPSDRRFRAEVSYISK